MDRKRIILALCVALVVAVGATYFFLQRLKSEQARHPQTIKIVVAVKGLSPGAPLSGDNVKLLDWPASVQIGGSFEKIDQVVGRSLIYPVNENQPILDRDLALPGSGIGLTVKIPDGMRGISVRSNEIVGVAGFLYPGSHVDVLVTSQVSGTNTPVTQTILQNVEVLTAGQRIEPDPNGKPETVSVVTLLLKPEDGEKLVLATTQGSVHFVLRNGADQNSVVTKAVRMDDLMVTVKKPPEAPKRAPVKVAAKPPNFYEVETIVGGKRNVDKFDEEQKAQKQ